MASSRLHSDSVKLSVNLNKIALLRQAREENRPNLETAGKTVLQAGANGLTLHPRPDRRHATWEDTLTFRKLINDFNDKQPDKKAELNIEGNPLAQSREGYPGLLEIVRQCRPDQVTWVPDTETQRTSNHGWKVQEHLSQIKPLLTQLKSLHDEGFSFRISFFMDVDSLEFPLVRELGVERIELYTKDYADNYGTAKADATLERYVLASRRAVAAGLAVNAGHDLNLDNLRTLATHLHGLQEVSIGHALIDDALYRGLDATVLAYLKALHI